MRYCKRCVMPDTRPGIKFDKEGICSACRHHERKKRVDWKKRWKELEELADKYRGCNGNYYDCIITASGGKDSYYQTYIFKEKLDMHPLILSVNSFSYTKTGLHNWDNMLNEFGVDAIRLSLNPKACKKMFKKGLERGIPTWYFDLAIYSWPLKMALQMGIPLVVYGENVGYEYGGLPKKEVPSAKKQIDNDVVKPIPKDDWFGNGITEKDFAPCEYSSNLSNLNPIYLSYYVKWSGYENMLFSKEHGFKTLEEEWKREGFCEDYDQIDTIGYLTHTWFKFLKFGHFRTTDVASIWVREGRITRKEAVDMVIENDWKLDKKMLNDFISYIGITEKEFWKIADKFANLNIIEKQGGNWRLKPNVIDALIGGNVVENR